MRSLQRLRGEVGHDHFLHPLHHPVGDGLANRDSADALHAGSNALQVLNVHGGEHANVGVEKLKHVFVALAVLAAFDVGVGKLIHQDHGRLAGQDAFRSISSKIGALIFDLLSRNGVELLRLVRQFPFAREFRPPR